ncbi:hypothetical protein PG985_005343 [Apiospora marii]|uniref:Uncharacterized protein n=1 Tax=Apiospora marii TaxID=335849 RepID=A0ABR1SBR3_9PEZI
MCGSSSELLTSSYTEFIVFAMLISNIVPVLATAAAVFAPAAAATDMSLKWHSKTDCNDHGGPVREYSRNNCIPLASTTHGVTIISHNPPCKSKRMSPSSRSRC